MSDVNEGLLERDEPPLYSRRCSECEGYKYVTVDGWCLWCLGEAAPVADVQPYRHRYEVKIPADKQHMYGAKPQRFCSYEAAIVAATLWKSKVEVLPPTAPRSGASVQDVQPEAASPEREAAARLEAE